jgi:hypothetical protein
MRGLMERLSKLKSLWNVDKALPEVLDEGQKLCRGSLPRIPAEKSYSSLLQRDRHSGQYVVQLVFQLEQQRSRSQRNIKALLKNTR